jgi:hypothetical protein
MATPTTKKIVFYGTTDGVFGPINPADVLAAIGLTPTAPVVIAPDPIIPVKPDRVVIGTSAVTGGVMELGKFDGLPWGLAEIISRDPESYRYRGGNYPIKFTGGYSVKDLAGIGSTAYDGKEQPLHERPKGFYRKLFPDAKGKGDFYYVKGDQPDEVFKLPADPSKPVTPTPDTNAGNSVRPPVDVPIDSGDQAVENETGFYNTNSAQ